MQGYDVDASYGIEAGVWGRCRGTAWMQGYDVDAAYGIDAGVWHNAGPQYRMIAEWHVELNVKALRQMYFDSQ